MEGVLLPNDWELLKVRGTNSVGSAEGASTLQTTPITSWCLALLIAPLMCLAANA
jgi:hypothetical protein